MPRGLEPLYVRQLSPQARAAVRTGTTITSSNRDFWMRVYHGITYPVGHVLEPVGFCITPEYMRQEDWETLSAHFLIDMRAEYRWVLGYDAGAGIGPRVPYKRHYEIESLELPG